jgi:hypothetical protein
MPAAPNALVIGAPKSGTTSLYFYLRDHPDIFVPERKELHYFTYEDLLAHSEGPGDKDALKGLCATYESYLDKFSRAGSKPLRIDISPSYLYFDHVAPRIKETLGDVKIVALLRDPVQKAYSQYTHMVGDLRETLPFYEALMKEEDRRAQGWGDMWRYAESSLYTTRIRRYLDVFGKDNVKVIIFDDFVKDTPAAVRDLLQFLGVNSECDIRTEGQFNRTGPPRSKVVAKLLTRDSAVKSAVKALLPERMRMSLRQQVQNANAKEKEPMPEEARSYLGNYFREDVAALGDLLGRKLNWLKG